MAFAIHINLWKTTRQATNTSASVTNALTNLITTATRKEKISITTI